MGRSPVWQHFTSAGGTKVKCNYCAHATDLGPTKTTTPMQTHLRSKHKDVWKGIEKQKKEEEKYARATLKTDLPAMRLAVLDGLANRMSAYMDDANLVIATLLDPRYKTTFFSHLSENEQNKVVKSLVKEVEWLLDDGSVADSASEDGDAGPPGDSMAGMLAEYAAKVTPAEPRRKRMREEVNSKQVAEVQVAEYVNDKPINFDADPMDYWRLNGEKWPALRMLARKFLSAPAGSIESERLFSTAGHIVSKLRKKLLPRNVENLLFVHHNVPIYGFGKW